MKNKIYLPTLTELIAIPLGVTLLLILTNISGVRSLILSGSQAKIADSVTQNWGIALDKPFINQWGVFVFWMGVGIVVYSLIGLLGTIAHAYKSDVPAHEFLTATRRSSGVVARARHEAIVHMMLRSLAVGGIMLWLIVNFGFLIQLCTSLFLYAMQFRDIIVGLTVIIVASLNIFLFIVLARLFLLRTRVFG